MASTLREVRGESTNVGNVRGLNVLLGIWLFISAFVWPHTGAQMTNTWIVGALIAILAAISFVVQPLRYVNALLAIWLFISSLVFPRVTDGTAWNNCLVAIAVLLVALVPSGQVRGHFFDNPSHT